MLWFPSSHPLALVELCQIPDHRDGINVVRQCLIGYETTIDDYTVDWWHSRKPVKSSP